MSRLGAWCAESEVGRRVSVVVIGCDLIGILIGAVVLVADLNRDRPVDRLGLLLVPGLALVAVGQILAIGVFEGRIAPFRGDWSGRRRLSWRAYKAHRRALSPLAGLPRVAQAAVVALGLGAWLSYLGAAFAGGPAGNREASGPGCRYPLDDHGRLSCVSRAAYEHAGAGNQCFVVSVVVFLLVMQAAVLWGNLRISVPLPDGSAAYDAVGHSDSAGQQDDGQRQA